MTEGLYYIVTEETNLRERTAVSMSKWQINVYDSIEIAQARIDEDVEYRKQVRLPPINKRVPISVVEYKERYNESMEIDQ